MKQKKRKQIFLMIFQFLYVCLYDQVKQKKGKRKTKFLCNKAGEAKNANKLHKT